MNQVYLLYVGFQSACEVLPPNEVSTIGVSFAGSRTDFWFPLTPSVFPWACQLSWSLFVARPRTRPFIRALSTSHHLSYVAHHCQFQIAEPSNISTRTRLGGRLSVSSTQLRWRSITLMHNSDAINPCQPPFGTNLLYEGNRTHACQNAW